MHEFVNIFSNFQGDTKGNKIIYRVPKRTPFQFYDSVIMWTQCSERVLETLEFLQAR